MRTVAFWLAMFAAYSAAAVDWTQPWAEPQDAGAAAARSDEYAWRLFVALDWPANPVARAADPRASFGADRPVVWETWQNTSDVYLDGGTDPGPWPAGTPVDGLLERAAAHRFAASALGDLPNARHVVGGVMVPFADPVAAAVRLTEIRMNRSTFEYIRGHALYSLDGQLETVAGGRPVEFPMGAKEVKAKWRPIDAAERSRYHTMEVLAADGSIRLYGLTALHIVSKDLPTWFWATFEHVENPALADNEGWRLPSHDEFACRDAAPDCNRAPRGIGLDGTVWQYYRLRGTLTRYADAQQHPLMLANSELERGFQESASCMTCHARAVLAIVAGAPLRLPIFDSAGGESPRARRGFVGAPSAEWFTLPGAITTARAFQRQDFVWSLSQAKPKTDRQLTSNTEQRGIP
ncbi:MAG TPA: hypothetical protein VGI51_05650 [Steroidobacteraceae bacterium]